MRSGSPREDVQRLLEEHCRVWHRKAVLRRIYRDEFFDRVLASCRPGGVSVEVGAGPAFLKERAPTVVSTDVVWCPWLDAVADAQHLPFRSGHVTNVLGVDVLHHVATPLAFLKEAERILINGGRLVLVEPWITPFSYLVYRYLHQEDCDLTADPLAGMSIRSAESKRPLDGNQAIPYLLFGPAVLARTLGSLPGFRPLAIEPFCLFAYLLSLGFKRASLLPEWMYPVVSRLEHATIEWWRSAAALRALIVLEKQAG